MVEVITTNTATLGTSLLAVGGLGIAVSAGIFGLRKGWAFFRGMVKG